MPPIEDQDDKLELDSSDSSVTLDEGTAVADDGKQPASADSSSAQGDNAETDLLSVVRDVVDGKKPGGEAPPAEGAKDGQATDEGAPKKEADDEDYSDVPFHKHPRFQQLLRQRNTFKQDAVRYQNVQTFLDTNGLSAQEASDGLVIMALAKTNPSEAWKQLKPFVEKVLQDAGEMLPEDLQRRVQAGELTSDAAFEISRARGKAQSVEMQRTFEQQQAERRREMEAAQALANAANDWERARIERDPNYDAKREPLRKEIAYLQLTEGTPKTPDGVRDQLERAYKAVNDALPKPAPPAPQRRAIRPVTGGQVAGNTRPEPKSTLDVIRQVQDARAS